MINFQEINVLCKKREKQIIKNGFQIVFYNNVFNEKEGIFSWFVKNNDFADNFLCNDHDSIMILIKTLVCKL